MWSQPADDEVLMELIRIAIFTSVVAVWGVGIVEMATKGFGLLVAKENTEQKLLFRTVVHSLVSVSSWSSKSAILLDYNLREKIWQNSDLFEE